MEDINKIILNPIRMRIIQYLASHKNATASQMSEFMTDIPKTTLYRHIGVLNKHHIIEVIEETQIRGTVEKTYGLNLSTIQGVNTKENATQNAFNFLMKIYADYHAYFKNENADPGKDRIFLNNTQLLLSDEEFDNLLSDIREILIVHLNNEPNEKRRQRSLSIISTPCNFEEDN